MKRYGLLILIAAAGCSPHYTSGKTQCSDLKECPDGFSCSDDGTNGVHFCVDNKTLSCPDTSNFYCSQSKTCWAKPGACSTVTECKTTKHPGSVICASIGYHPDCNGDMCLANGAVPDGGTGKGGTGGTLVGAGGSTLVGAGGAAGASGLRDAGIPGTGGAVSPPVTVRDAGTGGSTLVGAGGVSSGGLRDAGSLGTGGVVATGGVRDAGVPGTGGMLGSGGVTGRGGTTSGGGSIYCSGTPMACSARTNQAECQWGTGCTWNATSSVCSGTVSGCSAYSTSTTCIINSCAWSGTLTCSKTTMTSTCSSLAASSTVTCDLCMYNSCCGQITNCTNDTTCNTTTSGPLWNAYLDCAANCCGSSCTF